MEYHIIIECCMYCLTQWLLQIVVTCVSNTACHMGYSTSKDSDTC